MTGFDPRAISSDYAATRDLPDPLLRLVLRARGGSVATRTRALRELREGWLAGRPAPLPDALLGPALAREAKRLLDVVSPLALAAGGPEAVDKLLSDLLEASARAAPDDDALNALLAELRATATQEQRDLDGGELAAATEALEEVGARREVAALEASWAPRVRLWGAVKGVYGEVGEALGLGWDLGTAVLRHGGWTTVASLHALLERSPELVALVRSLGRLRAGKEGAATTDLVHRPLRRTESQGRAPDPRARSETRGIERSGSLTRMLPAEAALLTHKTLRKLFHARRAEHALATYRVEGVGAARRLDEAGPDRGETTAPRPRDRGPVIVLLDTSASMSGAPESVAKAVVLEALRVAHAEARPCWLYAFGGPNEIVELELSASQRGLASLLDFLQLSFHGGTDTSAPLRRALAKLATDDARDADVLLVSDGAFPLSEELAAPIAAARLAGTRFHGLLVGMTDSPAMIRLCDPLHRFSTWKLSPDPRS